MAHDSAGEMSKLITDNLLRILTEGRKAVSKDGQIVMVDASPSDIREARAWVAKLESSGVRHDTNSPQGRLREAALAKFNGRPIDMSIGEAG